MLRRDSPISESVAGTTRVKSRPVHQNLDTAYVNLAAFVRYLQQRQFDGYIHVELDEYDADVLLSANGEAHVRERDHTTGREAEGGDALQRLFVRAIEPGGLVSVYENVVEEESNIEDDELAAIDELPEIGAAQTTTADEEDEWHGLVRLSGELIATIERAALSAGADFANIFRVVRLGMADDFPFLDPSAGRFDYAHGIVDLRAQPNQSAYVSSIAEAMRRVVDKIATGPRRASIRERVALELAVFARRRQSQLAKFKFTPQLDRIAGTRVL
ncbi:MAG TPA: hypothetical protein VF779_20410 [Pyrinomonadaceae bacterium]